MTLIVESAGFTVDRNSLPLLLLGPQRYSPVSVAGLDSSVGYSVRPGLLRLASTGQAHCTTGAGLEAVVQFVRGERGTFENADASDVGNRTVSGTGRMQLDPEAARASSSHSFGSATITCAHPGPGTDPRTSSDAGTRAGLTGGDARPGSGGVSHQRVAAVL